MEWLEFVYAICTSGEPPAHWREIAFVSNLAIALAYFWIPAVMGVVFARWKEELPYRWLWVGFVTFITACGLSHVVHAFHLLRDQTPHSPLELGVLVGTAVISLATAAGFTYLLPRILRLASPTSSRRRLEEAVERATADLQAALDQQRLLLLEVHHRVKNNLQVVTSLVSLHIRKASSDPTTGLKNLQERIGAIAAVHGQLEQVGAAALQARQLVRSLATLLEASRASQGSVHVSGDNFVIPLDHASSFALIMHEVLANTMEHAFPAGQRRPVEARLSADGWTRTVMVVDRGVGMDPDANDGIGRTLVKALAVQLGATVVWTGHPEGGTCFILQFQEHTPPQRIPNGSPVA
jgi:two-component sensor histidine kinase